MRSRLAITDLFPRDGRLWLVVSVGLLLAGWLKGINLLMLLAYLLLGVWAVNLVAALRQPARISARRIPHGPFFVGSVCVWHVEVTNLGRKTSSGWRVVDRGPAHECAWFLDRIACGESVRVSGQAVFRRRGLYAAEPVMAQCLYPFGLAQRMMKLSDAHRWVVLPALGKLDVEGFRQWVARAAHSDGQVIRTSRPSMVRQDDLHGLRPFRPGDSPRWIHWRTSARRNQKMVREFEEAAGQNLVLIVDPWGPEEHLAELDRAISLAATVCWEWARHGHDQLFFAVAGRKPAVVAGSSTREKSLLMLQSLAEVEGEVAPDVMPLMQSVAHKVVPVAPVVVVSARPNSPLVGQVSSVWNRRVIGMHVSDAHAFYEEPSMPPDIGLAPESQPTETAADTVGDRILLGAVR